MAVLPASAALAQEDLQTMQVREIIGKLHVSGVTEEALAGQSIKQMIEGLKDPYTVFFSQEEYGQFSSSLENNYVGMGARIGIDEKGVYLSEILQAHLPKSLVCSGMTMSERWMAFLLRQRPLMKSVTKSLVWKAQK